MRWKCWFDSSSSSPLLSSSLSFPVVLWKVLSQCNSTPACIMYSHLLISLTDADVESPQSSITAHNMFSDVVAQVLQSRTELHASTFDKQLFMLSLSLIMYFQELLFNYCTVDTELLGDTRFHTILSVRLRLVCWSGHKTLRPPSTEHLIPGRALLILLPGWSLLCCWYTEMMETSCWWSQAKNALTVAAN